VPRQASGTQEFKNDHENSDAAYRRLSGRASKMRTAVVRCLFRVGGRNTSQSLAIAPFLVTKDAPHHSSGTGLVHSQTIACQNRESNITFPDWIKVKNPKAPAATREIDGPS
jgi:hypothetical protein